MLFPKQMRALSALVVTLALFVLLFLIVAVAVVMPPVLSSYVPVIYAAFFRVLVASELCCRLLATMAMRVAYQWKGQMFVESTVREKAES